MNPLGAREMSRAGVITIDHIMEIVDILDIAVAPDASSIAYVQARPDLISDCYHTHIWVTGTDGDAPVQLTHGPGEEDSPQWSPAGTALAFLSAREDGHWIHIVDWTTKEQRQVPTAERDILSFQWSPHGTQLAFLAAGDDRAARAAQIFVIDLQTGVSRQLTSSPTGVSDYAWSPNGTDVVFATRHHAPTEPDSRTEISVASVESGAVRQFITREGTDTWWPAWSPDGTMVAFVASKTARDVISNTYLYVLSSTGGAPECITEEIDERITWFAWSSDSASIFFSVGQGPTTQLLSVSLGDRAIRQVSTGDRCYTSFSLTQDSRTAAFLATEPGKPPDVSLSPTDHFQPLQITHANAFLSDLEVGKLQVVRWTSADGLEIEGLLLKPVGYRGSVRHPLLTYLHGGPTGAFRLAFAPQFLTPLTVQMEPYPVHVFAGEGFAVFMPNPRGSSGYGESFRRGNVRDWGGGDYRDVMSGIDFLIERGVADETRLGIMGGSYGGYLAAWTITQTDRFRAASIYAGPKDLVRFFSADVGPYGRSYFSDVPARAPEEYEARSTMSFVDHITTPTLIQHGEKDPINPLEQDQTFYQALKERRVDVELIVYEGQGHVVTSPQQQRAMLEHNLHWFKRRLKG